MLTDRQRARCRELAAALDSGDMATYRRAEPALGVEERGAVWDARKHVQAQAARAAQRQVSSTVAITPTPRRIETGLRLDDLDFWLDAPDAPDDDDDPMPVCGACKGSGRDTSGGKCVICAGKGRIPAEDQENDDDEDDRRKDDDDDIEDD
jgi:hypothetical protein